MLTRFFITLGLIIAVLILVAFVYPTPYEYLEWKFGTITRMTPEKPFREVQNTKVSDAVGRNFDHKTNPLVPKISQGDDSALDKYLAERNAAESRWNKINGTSNSSVQTSINTSNNQNNGVSVINPQTFYIKVNDTKYGKVVKFWLDESQYEKASLAKITGPAKIIFVPNPESKIALMGNTCHPYGQGEPPAGMKGLLPAKSVPYCGLAFWVNNEEIDYQTTSAYEVPAGTVVEVQAMANVSEFEVAKRIQEHWALEGFSGALEIHQALETAEIVEPEDEN
jgi:hypothetical protein